MARNHIGWLVFALGLVLAPVTACKKDDSAGGGAGGGAASKGGADDLSLLPVDSQIVAGFNFSQIQQSALWQKFVQPQLMGADAQGKLKEFQDACGFNPVSAIKSISIGVTTADKPSGVVVIHGPDKTKSLACLESPKVKAEMAKGGTEYTRDGDVVLIKDKRGQQSAMMFVNDSTAIAAFGEHAGAAEVKAAAAGTSALKTSDSFVKMYSKVKTDESLWFLIHDSSLLAKLPGANAKALFGSLNVTDGLSADVRMRLATPQAATDLAALAKGQLQQAAQFVDKSDVSTEDSDVKISISLSAEKLKQLGGLLGGAIGMGLGGMGGQ